MRELPSLRALDEAGEGGRGETRTAPERSNEIGRASSFSFPFIGNEDDLSRGWAKVRMLISGILRWRGLGHFFAPQISLQLLLPAAHEGLMGVSHRGRGAPGGGRAATAKLKMPGKVA